MPRRDVEPRLLTKEEAASYCGVSAPVFSDRCPVAPVALGEGKTRYVLSDLDDWIDSLGGRKNPKPSARASIVYFVGYASFVKIGWTRNFASRFRYLQSGCPEPLRVYLTCAGSRQDEREFHEKFAHLRLEGEWFRFADELSDFLSRYETR